MLRVQFNGLDSMQQVEFNRISPDTVELKGEDIPKSKSGFKMYMLNGNFLGDYSAYTDIVEEGKDYKHFKENANAPEE